MIERPPLHSVWENDNGEEYFVEDVSEPDDDEPDFFSVSYVPLKDKDNMGAVGFEADNDEWAEFVAANRLRIRA